MPVPDFVVELRRALGTAPLWLAGVAAVTIRGGRVLLVKRSDSGAWTAVTGIVEPGENPARLRRSRSARRDRVSARASRLAWLHVTQPAVHADGDQAQYRDQVFRMHWLAGEPYAADDEACSTSPTVRR